MLAQLKARIARLNYYVYQIMEELSEQGECIQAKETVEQFLFPCIKWILYRGEMLQETDN